ncbi:NUDIX hydrolase [Nonomuraea maritima]|uniref:NUDIX hydrolase n=1 Tax=Nonomuraea maritima TaxID=683260 RepID=UPI00372219D4
MSSLPDPLPEFFDCHCPDIYYCARVGEVECPRHSGFDVCCDAIDQHIPIRALPAPRPIFRASARVLLVDNHDRILLYRALPSIQDPYHAWYTPGGGIEPGETPRAAAARELREEIGHAVRPEALGPVVATSAGDWIRHDGTLMRSEDFFFFLRVPALQVDISAMEQSERSLIDFFRWWTPADLHALDELVFPIGLADLLERLVSGETPSEPVVMRWDAPDPTTAQDSGPKG